MNKNTSRIFSISKGDRVTATKLNQYAKGLNSLARGMDSPTNRGEVFGEISREVKIITITPEATIAGSGIMTDYPNAIITVEPVEFEQIESVTFKDGRGKTITLQFFNPVEAP